jgi:hypothetical protein
MQRRPFPTNELIWGSTFITHVDDEYNMRVLCVTYRIIPPRALSQVAHVAWHLRDVSRITGSDLVALRWQMKAP